MKLVLDIGNTHVHGGVFSNDVIEPIETFRLKTMADMTADSFGIKILAYLQCRGVDHSKISDVGICSVVPSLRAAATESALKFFNASSFEILSGIKTGLKIKIKNPQELGADRVVNAAYASHQFPTKDIIIVDFGTATTICCVNKAKEYLGGMIMPGLKISQQTLSQNAAKLPSFAIEKPDWLLGKSTVESLQAGLFYSHLGAIRHIVSEIRLGIFNEQDPIIIGTGGYAQVVCNELPFDLMDGNFTLKGIRHLMRRNSNLQ